MKTKQNDSEPILQLQKIKLKRRMEAALVFAAANGNARKVAELLSQGGRVDTRTKDSI